MSWEIISLFVTLEVDDHHKLCRNASHNNYRNRHIVQDDITRIYEFDCIIVTIRSYVNPSIRQNLLNNVFSSIEILFVLDDEINVKTISNLHSISSSWSNIICRSLRISLVVLFFTITWQAKYLPTNCKQLRHDLHFLSEFKKWYILQWLPPVTGFSLSWARLLKKTLENLHDPFFDSKQVKVSTCRIKKNHLLIHSYPFFFFWQKDNQFSILSFFLSVIKDQ